jgi:hypothetical protein
MLKHWPAALRRSGQNCFGDPAMLRTVFMIGLFALLGLFALKLAFGLFGFLFSILLVLLWWAVKIAIVGLIIYFVIRLVSPDTASRLRSRWSGP